MFYGECGDGARGLGIDFLLYVFCSFGLGVVILRKERRKRRRKWRRERRRKE